MPLAHDQWARAREPEMNAHPDAVIVERPSGYAATARHARDTLVHSRVLPRPLYECAFVHAGQPVHRGGVDLRRA